MYKLQQGPEKPSRTAKSRFENFYKEGILLIYDSKTISLALQEIDHGGRAGETGVAIAPPILGRNKKKSKPVPWNNLLLP